MANSATQITIGFSGGQTLSARAPSEQVQALRNAIAALGSSGASASGAPSWFQLQAEDGTIDINAAQVVYLRAPSDEHRVGFRA